MWSTSHLIPSLLSFEWQNKQANQGESTRHSASQPMFSSVSSLLDWAIFTHERHQAWVTASIQRPQVTANYCRSNGFKRKVILFPPILKNFKYDSFFLVYGVHAIDCAICTYIYAQCHCLCVRAQVNAHLRLWGNIVLFYWHNQNVFVFLKCNTHDNTQW